MMHLKRFGLMVGMALLCSPLWALTSSQAHDIAVGDTVVYSKYGGTEVSHKGDDLLILTSRDVLAIVGK